MYEKYHKITNIYLYVHLVGTNIVHPHRLLTEHPIMQLELFAQNPPINNVLMLTHTTRSTVTTVTYQMQNVFGHLCIMYMKSMEQLSFFPMWWAKYNIHHQNCLSKVIHSSECTHKGVNPLWKLTLMLTN